MGGALMFTRIPDSPRRNLATRKRLWFSLPFLTLCCVQFIHGPDAPALPLIVLVSIVVLPTFSIPPAAQIFSYAGLCNLTRQYVTGSESTPCERGNNDDDDDDNNGVAHAMCRKLRAAQAAEAHGDFEAKRRLLRAYMNQVSAQTDKTLTPSRASTLITLARTL